MLSAKHEPHWQPRTGFAATHCRKCDNGWTRTGIGGGEVVICLLDRQPVLANMADCDRYEPKQPL